MINNQAKEDTKRLLIEAKRLIAESKRIVNQSQKNIISQNYLISKDNS